jgi:hypothetical protein
MRISLEFCHKRRDGRQSWNVEEARNGPSKPRGKMIQVRMKPIDSGWDKGQGQKSCGKGLGNIWILLEREGREGALEGVHPIAEG